MSWRTPMPRRAACLRSWRTATRRLKAVEREGDEEHDHADPEALELRGMEDRPDALGDRDGPAHDEHPDGGQERPEVAVRAVAERMRGVGRPTARAVGDVEQRLVAGVRDRVQRLREERGRAGQRRRRALGDGDRRVRRERRQDAERALRTVGRAGGGPAAAGTRPSCPEPAPGWHAMSSGLAGRSWRRARCPSSRGEVTADGQGPRGDHDVGRRLHHRADDGPGKGLGEGGERLHYWVFGGPWTYDDEPKGEPSGEDAE